MGEKMGYQIIINRYYYIMMKNRNKAIIQERKYAAIIIQKIVRSYLAKKQVSLLKERLQLYLDSLILNCRHK